MNEWDMAYEEFPELAADYAWAHIVELLERYPGRRLYEVGFGSGTNLLWARRHGWLVAGCEVADAPMAIARKNVPGADLRKESIVDCSAPSGHYDMVIDRAALSSLAPGAIEMAVAQIRRILKDGGIFFFNPYAADHTRPFPESVPTQYLWDMDGVQRLLPETEWEFLDGAKAVGHDNGVESTLRVTVRKR